MKSKERYGYKKEESVVLETGERSGRQRIGKQPVPLESRSLLALTRVLSVQYWG